MRLASADMLAERPGSLPVVMRKWQGRACRTSDAVRLLTSLRGGAGRVREGGEHVMRVGQL